MTDIFSLFFIWVAVTGLAIRALQILNFSFTDEGEKLVFATALGLGFLAYLVFILGCFGLLHKNLFLGILTALFVISWRPVWNLFTTLIARRLGFRELGFLKLTIFILMAVVFIFVLSAAAAPPVGQDELCYHLQNPKVFVRDHAVREISYSTSSLWPYLTEMLFTLGILMRGPELAKLFHAAFFILTAFAIACFIRRHSDHKKAAGFGAAAFWLTPAVFMQATFAYIDNAVAAFFFLAFYALYNFLKTDEKKWAVLAGVFTGFLISTKYLGLFALPLGFVVFLIRMFKSANRKNTFISGMGWASALLAAGGAWYIRSAVLRGNPVFPFMGRFFGGAQWTDKVINASVHGRGANPFSFFLLPWDLTVHPDWFGGEQIGVLFLAFLPIFILTSRKDASSRFMLWVGLGYTAIWFFVEQNVRFLFPGLAVLSVCVGQAAASLTQTDNRILRRIFSFLIITVFAMQASFAVYHYRDELSVLLGRDSRDHYLSTHERSYNAAKVVNRALKESDKILSTGESRGFYFHNPFTLEGDFNNFTHYGRGDSPEEVAAKLKEAGFTHVLSSSLEGTLDDSADNQNRVQRILSNPVLRERFFTTNLVLSHQGVRYVLYRIK